MKQAHVRLYDRGNLSLTLVSTLSALHSLGSSPHDSAGKPPVSSQGTIQPDPGCLPASRGNWMPLRLVIIDHLSRDDMGKSSSEYPRYLT
ncbi:hypothetical protein BDW42DRAFT_180000 [Aspergillus taichungensis]|uniref:Uncharacterized protein n=1 Tax=Aspergillus taichungensis TaxID=482145 RepID=A0A2J5HG04_9EURO|nr:hypothetical protein BDW42DRAFT_180000 [Aspergillus taichungensis]